VVTRADLIDYHRLRELTSPGGPARRSGGTRRREAAGLTPGFLRSIPTAAAGRGRSRPSPEAAINDGLGRSGSPGAGPMRGAGGRHRVTLLSPFDSLVWDRKAQPAGCSASTNSLEAYVPRARRGALAVPRPAESKRGDSSVNPVCLPPAARIGPAARGYRIGPAHRYAAPGLGRGPAPSGPQRWDRPQPVVRPAALRRLVHQIGVAGAPGLVSSLSRWWVVDQVGPGHPRPRLRAAEGSEMGQALSVGGLVGEQATGEDPVREVVHPAPALPAHADHVAHVHAATRLRSLVSDQSHQGAPVLGPRRAGWP